MLINRYYLHEFNLNTGGDVMNTQHVLNVIKAGIAVGISALGMHLGGFDEALRLLLWLILADIVTGFIKAAIHKDLASRELFLGAIRKCLMLVCILVCYKIDHALQVYVFTEGGKPLLSVRLFVIVYFTIEELLSGVENLQACGVKLPKFVAVILRNVSDVTNSSPTAFINTIRSIFSGRWSEILGNEYPKPHDIPAEPEVHENLIHEDGRGSEDIDDGK